jgi:hypothetical protein
MTRAWIKYRERIVQRIPLVGWPLLCGQLLNVDLGLLERLCCVAVTRTPGLQQVAERIGAGIVVEGQRFLPCEGIGLASPDERPSYERVPALKAAQG